MASRPVDVLAPCLPSKQLALPEQIAWPGLRWRLPAQRQPGVGTSVSWADSRQQLVQVEPCFLVSAGKLLCHRARPQGFCKPRYHAGGPSGHVGSLCAARGRGGGGVHADLQGLCGWDKRLVHGRSGRNRLCGNWSRLGLQAGVVHSRLILRVPGPHSDERRVADLFSYSLWYWFELSLSKGMCTSRITGMSRVLRWKLRNQFFKINSEYFATGPHLAMYRMPNSQQCGQV